jgi:hypothetical protein
MKKAIFWAALLALCVLTAAPLMAQVTERLYAYTFDKGVGDCLFTGVSKDAAWSATLKALALIKHQILSAEKQSGTISSRRKIPKALGVFGALAGSGLISRRNTVTGGSNITRKDEMPGFDLVFEEREGGVGILAMIIEGEGQMPMGKKGSRIFAKKLFDKVAELLYGANLK